MTKKLEKLEVAAVSPFGTTSLPCGLCGGPHDSQTCNFITDDQPSAEQVNYMGNQPRPPHNDPYSNTFNPGWKNHPNFSWGGNQGQRIHNNFHDQNHPYQPPFQRQQPYQQPPLPPHPIQKQSQPSSL
ncbi:hypothetical protein PIB30_096490 [Stylosanthes scabra]|uniref:Uncharacterized protein n=1 Tax=Stylosanthes scabra TaxID=79078 RepID=A0ABU6ZUM3_9FABA|nr:hypothetical protein [Stylosanthes scabra]